ncbi:MAG: hypothetical protein ACE5WD_02225 [Candidatus Aminicenantia bacterium]
MVKLLRVKKNKKEKITNNIIIENKRKASKILLIYIFFVSLLLFFIILKIASSRKENSDSFFLEKITYSSEKKSENVLNRSSLSYQSGEDSSVLKTYLLKKRKFSASSDLEKSGRDIFKYAQEVVEKIEPPPAEDEKEEPEPEVVLPPTNLKLIGILVRQAHHKVRQAHNSGERNIKYVILSREEEIYIVKKGDVLDSRYEVLDISEESVEIKDVEFNRTVILILESE